LTGIRLHPPAPGRCIHAFDQTWILPGAGGFTFFLSAWSVLLSFRS